MGFLIEEMGLSYHKATEKYIPKFAFEYNKESLEILLGKMWEGLKYEEPITWNLTLILMGKIPRFISLLLSFFMKITDNEWLSR